MTIYHDRLGFCSFFFLSMASVAWNLLVPMPTVVHSSSSPNSTTTCLLKCIMSLSVERMTVKLLCENYNELCHNYFYSVRLKCSVLLPFWPPLFLGFLSFKESDAIFSQQTRETQWISTIWSSLTGLCFQTELENWRGHSVCLTKPIDSAGQDVKVDLRHLYLTWHVFETA